MTATATPTQTYDVSWTVFVQARAKMQVEAPAGLTEDELQVFIQNECAANFEIDTSEVDYDDGFAELDREFDFDGFQHRCCRRGTHTGSFWRYACAHLLFV